MEQTDQTAAKTEPRAAMAVVVRLDGFVNYIYPMLTNTSRQHRVLRDTMIAAIFEQYRLFHAYDRWLVHTVGVKQFARYMDDVVVVGYSREAMALLQTQAASFTLQSMGLRFSRWSVLPWTAGVNFCGYRIWPTHKLLRKSSVIRAKRKLRNFDARGDAEGRLKFLAAWRGHAQWADTHHLIQHLGVEHD